MFGLGWQELLLVLLVGGVVYLLFFSTPVRRRLTASINAPLEKPEGAARAEGPEDVLAMRFARGEIDQAQYDAMRATIQRNRT